MIFGHFVPCRFKIVLTRYILSLVTSEYFLRAIKIEVQLALVVSCQKRKVTPLHGSDGNIVSIIIWMLKRRTKRGRPKAMWRMTVEKEKRDGAWGSWDKRGLQR